MNGRSSSAWLQPHILDAAERSKGAAGFRCRQLDGRAAILMVVARPGGFEVAGLVWGSSARWPFTCLEAIRLSSFEGSRNTSRGVARISSHPTLAFAHLPPAMRIAGHLATPFIPQLTDRLLSGSLRPGDEMLLKTAFVLLLAWLLGALGLYRIGDLVHVLLLVG